MREAPSNAGAARPVGRRGSGGWFALAGYLVTFAALAWRWLVDLDSAAPSGNHPSDARLTVWILAWVARTLSTDASALFDAPIFHPAPAQITASEHFLSSQILFAPLYRLTGNPVLAANALAWISYPLGAFAMERLLVTLGISRAAAWASGLLFALGPLRVPASLQVPQLLNLYFPLTALALHRLRDDASARRAAVLAAALGLAVLSSYYVAAMTAVVSVVWGLLEWLRPAPGSQSRTRFVVTAGVIGVAVAVLLGVVSKPYFDRPEPARVTLAGESPSGPQPSAGVATPVPWAAVRPLVWPTDHEAAPLLAAVGLAGIAVRGLRLVAGAGLAFLVIGAGSLLWLVAAGGMSTEVGSWLGFFRHAYRTQLLTGFGAALLAAAALDAMRRAFGARIGIVVATAATAMILNEQGSRLITPDLDSVALSRDRVAAYTEIGRLARAAGGGAALELPVTGAGGVDLRPRAMLGGLHHELPLVNGFTGHLPPHFLFINNRVGRLPELAAVDDLIDATHLRWIILAPPSDWRSPEERERMRSALAAIADTEAIETTDFTLVRLDRTPRHDAWYSAIASGRGFERLPLDERLHLEPWAVRAQVAETPPRPQSASAPPH